MSGSPRKRPSAHWKRLVIAARGLAVMIALIVTSAACADGAFTVKYAPDFPKEAPNVSVFGVFNDGRMSTRAWEQVRLRLSEPFDTDACEAAYSDKLATDTPELSAAVDEYARTNGVTDDLLDQFAPMAKGDMIILFTVAGHPPQPIDNQPPNSQAPAPPKSRGRRGRGGPASTPRKKADDQSVFELSASFFSVRLHHSVALVAMTYSGSSVDEAFHKFADKLATEMPKLTCSDWNWEVHVDEKKINGMSEP